MASPRPSGRPDPRYVSKQCAEKVIAVARHLKMASVALEAVNELYDELVFIVVDQASAHSPQRLVNDELKAALAKTVGPSLSKEAFLEAEIALRELLRAAPPSMRGDPALKKQDLTASPSRSGPPTLEATYNAMRSWIMALSGLGAKGTPFGPPTVSALVDTLRIPPLCPYPASNVSFIAAFYLERCLSRIIDHVLRAIGASAARDPRTESVGLDQVEAAFKEDASIWSFVQSMKIMDWIEREKNAPRGNITPSTSTGKAPTTPVLAQYGAQPLGAGITGRGVGKRASTEQIVLPVKPASTGLGIDDSTQHITADFESLINSGRTMKVSLTPDRLRTMEVKTTSPALSPALTDSPMEVLTGSPGATRLQARSPIKREDLADDALNEPAQRDALVSMLNSPPPWASDSTEQRDDRSSPGQNSPSKFVSRTEASFAEEDSIDSSDSEYNPQNASPLHKRIKPKDIRKDVATERQVNYDLLDFFADVPPPSERRSPTKQWSQGSAGAGAVVHSINPAQPPAQSPPTSPLSSPKQSTPSPKKSKTGFRGLMNKVTGSGKKEAPSISSPTSPVQLSGYSRTAPSSVRSGSISSSKTASMGTHTVIDHTQPSSSPFGSHTVIDHTRGMTPSSPSLIKPADARVADPIRESASSPLHQFAASHGAINQFAPPPTLMQLKPSQRINEAHNYRRGSLEPHEDQQQFVAGTVTPPRSLRRDVYSYETTPRAQQSPRYEDAPYDRSRSAALGQNGTRSQSSGSGGAISTTGNSFATAAEQPSVPTQAPGQLRQQQSEDRPSPDPEIDSSTGASHASTDDLSNMSNAAIGVGTKRAVGAVGVTSVGLASVAAVSHDQHYPSSPSSQHAERAESEHGSDAVPTPRIPQSGSLARQPSITTMSPFVIPSSSSSSSAAGDGLGIGGTDTPHRQPSLSSRSQTSTVVAAGLPQQIQTQPHFASRSTSQAQSQQQQRTDSVSSSKSAASQQVVEAAEQLSVERLTSLREAMKGANSVDECLALLDALIVQSDTSRVVEPLSDHVTASSPVSLNGTAPLLPTVDEAKPTFTAPPKETSATSTSDSEHHEARMVDFLLDSKQAKTAGSDTQANGISTKTES